MRIIEISLKLGATVNLGDYNNFRPEIGGKAVVEPFDDPDEVYAKLEEQLAAQLARMVDDELERAGQTPRYATDLYTAQYSDLRQCVVVARAGVDLPVEKNWRDRDEWSRVSHDLPRRMRIDTARKAVIGFGKDYPLHFIHESYQLADLPPLPDPGPEPLWSQKGLKSWLERLEVPQAEWDMLAALPHVTSGHIEKVYRSSPFMTYGKLKDSILAAPPPKASEDDLPENGRFPDSWDEEE